MAKKMITFPSVTGETLEGALWIPETEGKGVVQLVHGMAEHIGRYEEPAEKLCEAGYIVVHHNHLGHGNTAPVKGYFAEKDGWEALLQDIDTVRRKTQKEYPALPYYLLGHSMGSFLVRCYLQEYDQDRQLDGAILSGTGYYGKGLVVFAKGLAKTMNAFGYKKKPAKLINTLAFSGGNKQFKPVKTEFDWTSRDVEKVRAYAEDPLCGFVFTGQGYYDLFSGLYRLSDKEKLGKMNPDLPVYFFSGDRDPVGSNGKGVKQVAEDFRQAGMKKVDVVLYPDGRHEMFNEINRKEVIDDLIYWLDGQVEQKAD
ncbi:MAG: alpha/beta hydrolase [Clostridiales bacterium]|nr:alpha/beta hydrolase [Clostridiales bacterium]